MSSMLEQAIVDAAALREAALKNAEQSLIEKYAPQIKEAVDSLLDKDILEEQETAASAPSASPIEAPFAAAPTTDANADVTFTMTDDKEEVYDFDLTALSQANDEQGSEGEQESTENLMGDLGLDMPTDDAGGGGEEALLEEIMDILSEVGEETNEEQEVIEEEVTMEMAGQHKNGTFETNEATLKYQEEMQMAIEEMEEENEKVKTD